jgi:hypothetical protein
MIERMEDAFDRVPFWLQYLAVWAFGTALGTCLGLALVALVALVAWGLA